MPEPENTTAGRFVSEASFETVLQHWGQARIDTPLTQIARFDEAAKNLIMIGGFLQALVLAVFGFSSATIRIPWWGAGMILVGLLWLMFSAARVICTLPPTAEAGGTYKLFQKIGVTGVTFDDLWDAVDRWCTEVDRVAKRKHQWLVSANITFLATSILTFTLLCVFMSPGVNK